MSETLSIRINQDHIMRGIRRNSTSCPLALAIRDTVAEQKGVRVDVAAVSVFKGGNRTEYTMDEASRLAISQYDCYGHMQPRTVTLIKTGVRTA
jgi:hypothetical protein